MVAVVSWWDGGNSYSICGSTFLPNGKPIQNTSRPSRKRSGRVDILDEAATIIRGISGGLVQQVGYCGWLGDLCMRGWGGVGGMGHSHGKKRGAGPGGARGDGLIAGRA